MLKSCCPAFGKAFSVHSSYTFTAGSAVFDEQNLVSSAGLVPVLELAEQTGLSRLIGEHVDLPSHTGEVRGGEPGRQADLDHRRNHVRCRQHRRCERAARRRHTAGVQRGVCALDAGDLPARVHLRARQPARRGGPRASGGAGGPGAAAGRGRRTRLHRHRLAAAPGLRPPETGRLVRARQDRQPRAAASGSLTADHHAVDGDRGAGDRRGAAAQRRAGSGRAAARQIKRPSAPPASAGAPARSWCAATRRSAPRR